MLVLVVQHRVEMGGGGVMMQPVGSDIGLAIESGVSTRP